MKTTNDELIHRLLTTGYLVVDSDDNIRNRAGKILKGSYTTNGYHGHCLMIEGKIRRLATHRIVYMHHHGIDVMQDKQVNHDDDNKLNNRISNLTLMTQGENIKHRYRENTKKTKFNDNDVIEMRRLHLSGQMNRSDLAKKYNCSYTTVHDVISNKTFKNVA